MDEKKESAAKGFMLSAVLWLFISTAVGLIVAIKFVYPDFLGGVSWLTFGRLRMVHVNGVIFGWLSMAYIGSFYYIVPRLTGVPLYSERLANLTLWLWNFLVIGAVVTLALGMNQGHEYAELIMPLDVLVGGLFIFIIINIFATVLGRKEHQLYVSLWYIMGSLIWTATLYIVENGFLFFDLTGLGGRSLYYGVNDANINWWYGHNVVGFWLTTPGLAIAYFFLPKAIQTPIYSHRLSLIGFWSIAFIYIWTGAHHLIYAPIPMWLQALAIIFSVLLIIPVSVVVTNFFGTMKGQWVRLHDNIPVKFIIAGTVFYLITCLQGPLQSIWRVSQLVHFTDWVVGHAHLAVAGFASMFASAAIYYAIPRLYGRELYSQGLANWHFWLFTIGMATMALSLWFGGLVQGSMWNVNVPFTETMKALRPYWSSRVLSGAFMVLSHAIFAYNIYKTVTLGKPVGEAESMGGSAL